MLPKNKPNALRVAAICLAAVLALGLSRAVKRAEAGAAYVQLAQYYPYGPPPNYYRPPPCYAYGTALGGAARGAAGGAAIGAIAGNAGRGAAIGAGIGLMGGAIRNSNARANGYCY
jgi:hypothetical protein